MRFLGRLKPGLIRVTPPWQSFAETVTGLVDTLAQERQLPPGCAAAAVQAVTAREVGSSTALLDIRAGVPHARLPGLARPVVAIATSSSGLYEAVPTVPIQIVILVLSPPDDVTNHLETLAGIATLLRSAEFRSALLRARDGDEALAVVKRHARVTP